VVQLKRFHYDRTSRRKLNDPIDFPLEALDISPYIAKSRDLAGAAKGDEACMGEEEEVKEGGEGEKEGEGRSSLSFSASRISDCTTYDLYSVIHHVGVMVSEGEVSPSLATLTPPSLPS
jgi:hypothetical protein